MSASLTWRPVPIDPEPLGSAKHPLLGLVLQALDTDEAGMGDGIVIAVGDDAFTFLRGALSALPERLPARVADHSAERWRVDLHSDLSELLTEISHHGSLLIEVRR